MASIKQELTLRNLRAIKKLIKKELELSEKRILKELNRRLKEVEWING